MTPRPGICQHCLREVGNLTLHERYCYSKNVPDVLKANNYAEEMTAMADRAASLRTELDEIAIERAGAHAAPKSALRRSQRFQRVTDQDVARAMYLIEKGTPFRLSPMGRWYGPTGAPTFPGLSQAIHEMIRTGLVRHLGPQQTVSRTHGLVPAPVHFLDKDGFSACKFPGEDRGPMRARLTKDLQSADCKQCQHVISTGELLGS